MGLSPTGQKQDSVSSQADLPVIPQDLDGQINLHQKSTQPLLSQLGPLDGLLIRKLSQGYSIHRFLLLLQEENYQYIRSIIDLHFSLSSVCTYLPQMKKRIQQVLKSAPSTAPDTLFQEYAGTLLFSLLASILGIYELDWPYVQRWLADWGRLLSLELESHEQAQCVESVLAFQAYSAHLAQQRCIVPRNDLTTDLVHASGPSHSLLPLRQADLAYLIPHLLLTSYETTMSACFQYFSQWQPMAQESVSISSLQQEPIGTGAPSLVSLHSIRPAVAQDQLKGKAQKEENIHGQQNQQDWASVLAQIHCKMFFDVLKELRSAPIQAKMAPAPSSFHQRFLSSRRPQGRRTG